MPTSNNQIVQIREMIKAGKKKQAVSLLAQLIERDHENPELWWLLANATDDLHQARRALEEMQSLQPTDDRARKMLARLETRQLLKQMGVNQSTAPKKSRRSGLLAIAALSAIVVLVMIVAVIVNNQNTVNLEPLPTVVVINPTVTALPPTQTELPQVNAPTEERTPFTQPTQPIEPTEILPTAVAVIPTDIPVEVAPPVEPFRETTAESTPPTLIPLATDPLIPMPETTAEPTLPPTDPNGNSTMSLGTETETQTETETEASTGRTPAAAVADDRGQLLVDKPKRDLIAPYGEHAYTFSGYRGETIVLDLVNISGTQGNPSLELRDANGYVLISDIDTVSGNNTDAKITFTLLEDGIYTVVVRMAAVEEQLYSLTLTRQ
ncbi:MAG: pre-peptidase C-terminal domain-containing protein [Anaerolineae bacterium]|jgi:hypothetical protein|nr:pre-peptidase C-terminal domain-containing protein [Anaerolineae bacterium]